MSDVHPVLALAAAPALLCAAWLLLSLLYGAGLRLWLGRAARALARQHDADVSLGLDGVRIQPAADASAHARQAARLDALAWSARLRPLLQAPVPTALLPAAVSARSDRPDFFEPHPYDCAVCGMPGASCIDWDLCQHNPSLQTPPANLPALQQAAARARRPQETRP